MPLGDELGLNMTTKTALYEADVIAYETLERLNDILEFNDIHTSAELICIYDHLNTDKVIIRLHEGNNVAVVVDEGQSGFADPGGDILNDAVENDIEVDAIPGPSSVMTAAALSGYNLDNFVVANAGTSDFDGLMKNIVINCDTTYILVEMQDRLNMLESYIPDRQITVCSSLDMPSQKVWRGRVRDIGSQKVVSKRGRTVVVIRGKDD